MTCQAVEVADEDGMHRLVVVQRRALDLAGNEILALNIELRQARELLAEKDETIARLNRKVNHA